jgi:hypothetical protein
MKLPYFKSAVAFFSLFFLHGTSIGTRQQGISYNLKIEPIPIHPQLGGDRKNKNNMKNTSTTLETCRSCNGSGIVWG